ncbi:hypothetical protein WJX73_002034 [Symbiochloris irregularis]|uniref:Tryptophan synthase beta chain-like PALP domain-containing protein n=1 Tax=Symbiochloris irregularis TaxID=706552 RepID=A0AAW1P541_9CHLO
MSSTQRHAARAQAGPTLSAILQQVAQNGWDVTEVESSPESLAARVLHAAAQISDAVRLTKLQESVWLDSTTRTNGRARLKLENEQVVGSFKIRGATNKLLSLSSTEAARGVVTCSTGNHALAVLQACALAEERRRGWNIKPIIYVPTTVSTAKADRLIKLGAHIEYFGEDCVDTENHARAAAAQQDQVYVSPYNDAEVASGQGTVALELLSQLTPEQLHTVYVPVGGGGLITGIASLLKAVKPRVQVVGCQPVASHVMERCVAAGKIVQEPSLSTLSDGTAGGVEENSITLQPCRHLVDRWVLVEEADIARAMVGLLDHDGLRLEGAAAMAVAAFIKDSQASHQSSQQSVVICCGGNVSDAAFAHARSLINQG